MSKNPLSHIEFCMSHYLYVLLLHLRSLLLYIYYVCFVVAMQSNYNFLVLLAILVYIPLFSFVSGEIDKIIRKSQRQQNEILMCNILDFRKRTT